MKIIHESKENIKEAVTALKNGAVLVLPTDTVYGLVCDATNENAVGKIYKIKQRPESKPLPIFVKDMEMAKKLADINEDQEKTLKEKWPGEYTFVLKRIASQMKVYGVDNNTIALRLPKYEFLNELLRAVDTPLSQTSVNISGQKPLSNIKEIIEIFKGEDNQPDLIIDSGDLPKNKPSIIIDLTNNKTKILRP